MGMPERGRGAGLAINWIRRSGCCVTAALDLALLGTGFEILCSRRLVRGLFPLNPFAAEFGSNYDVVVTVTASSDEIQSKVMGLLQSKYPCTKID